MATIDQSEFARYGAGDKSNVYVVVEKRVDLSMAAGATATAVINVPQNASVRGVTLDTAAAFSGAPTNINLTVGTAAAGAQVLAATDVKGQGHVTGVLAATFDNVGFAATGATVLFLTLTAVGGTLPGGTVSAFVRYAVPGEGN